jgi:uncharacterized protein YukE
MKDIEEKRELLSLIDSVLDDMETFRNQIASLTDSINGKGGQQFPSLRKMWERKRELISRAYELAEMDYNSIKEKL